jgi:hypothetical protein
MATTNDAITRGFGLRVMGGRSVTIGSDASVPTCLPKNLRLEVLTLAINLVPLMAHFTVGASRHDRSTLKADDVAVALLTLAA